MNADDSPRLFCQRLFYRSRIDLPCVRKTINEYWLRADVGDAPCACDKRMRRHDNLVSRSYPERKKCEVKRGRAASETACVLCTAICSKFFFEDLDEFAAGKRRFRYHRLYRRHELAPKRCMLPLKIKKRDTIHTFTKVALRHLPV